MNAHKKNSKVKKGMLLPKKEIFEVFAMFKKEGIFLWKPEANKAGQPCVPKFDVNDDLANIQPRLCVSHVN